MMIAVSLGVLENPTYQETRDTLSHDWVRFLDGQQVRPLMVPNALADPADFCRSLNVSGILLTSGNDLGPLTGEEWTGSDSVSPERDTAEYALVRYAEQNRIPLMGICRGMHTINAYFGGNLVRDVAAWTNGEQHVAVDHEVNILDREYQRIFLDRLGTKSFATNSYHNHGITVDGLAPILKALAATENGIIEALFHPRLPVLATQWHPERRNPDPEPASELFRLWLRWCQEAAQVTGLWRDS
jgi:putative glutamine amidotransferase